MQRPRPTSPHLTVWRWRIWAIASITHRITGIGLYFVGMSMFTWFLLSLALGPEQYAMFVWFAGSWLGQMILIGLTWAFFQHTASGIRHLVMDTGAGFGPSISRYTAAGTFVLSSALTIGLWIYICMR